MCEEQFSNTGVLLVDWQWCFDRIRQQTLTPLAHAPHTPGIVPCLGLLWLSTKFVCLLRNGNVESKEMIYHNYVMG